MGWGGGKHSLQFEVWVRWVDKYSLQFEVGVGLGISTLSRWGWGGGNKYNPP